MQNQSRIILRVQLRDWRVQLVVSLLLTILFGFLASFLKNFNGSGRFILLGYHVPIAFAFSMFALTELAGFSSHRMVRNVTSLLVTGFSLLRVLTRIPFYSGHAFFITYMVLMTESLTARIVAVLVLLDVFYVKVILLHDPTIWGGMILGLTAWAINKTIPVLFEA